MPWNKKTLALPASPPSVRLAREWVTGILSDIGRDELADSARLGVSELVTNAILHAEPPITVSVRGTVARPRIEVVDHTLIPRALEAPQLIDSLRWQMAELAP